MLRQFMVALHTRPHFGRFEAMQQDSSAIRRFPQLDDGMLPPLARWLSATLADRYDDRDGCLRMTIALAVMFYEAGHTCIDIAELGGRDFPFDEFLGFGKGAIDDNAGCVALPSAAEWRAALLASPACVPFPADSASDAPLQFHEDGGKFLVALSRFASREIGIARRLASMATANPVAESPPCHGRLTAEQSAAAEWALANRLTILSGGPGTGKTTAIANIIARLASANPALSVKMAAPSGKAAARMTESFREGVMPDGFTAGDATTIHRLLGIGRNGKSVRHNAGSPISADIVVVDEASMVSSELMALLLDAIADNTKLVMLGDVNQLKSVEPGNVFGALCRDADGRSGSPFSGSVHHLRRSFRFSDDKSVGRLASAIVDNRPQDACNELRNAKEPLRWARSWAAGNTRGNVFGELFGAFRNSRFDDPLTALSEVEKVRILCATNTGSLGCDAINGECVRWLRENIPNKCDPQPILILENDYDLKLFNGDTGVMMENPDKPGARRAFFRSFDGDGAGFREVAEIALPEFKPAYAMTIHKTQGSEYAGLAVVLPAGDSRILSRSLLYTAVTRFRETADGGGGLLVAAAEETVAAAISHEHEFESLFPAALMIAAPAR